METFLVNDKRKLGGEFIKAHIKSFGNEITEKSNVSYDAYENYPDFLECLEKNFNAYTAQKVAEAFQKLGLPIPAKREFLQSEQEGAIVFLNKYGLALRVERANAKAIDDPFISQRLASIPAGKAVIELHPAIAQETDQQNIDLLKYRLEGRNIDFWDYKFSNVGRAPIKTPKFPHGVTIVIDTGAVDTLSAHVEPIREALLPGGQKTAAQEVREAFEELYSPLRQAFEAACSDKEHVQAFWGLCAEYVQQGKLVTGWNESVPSAAMVEKCRYGDNSKISRAAGAAKRYGARL